MKLLLHLKFGLSNCPSLWNIMYKKHLCLITKYFFYNLLDVAVTITCNYDMATNGFGTVGVVIIFLK